ncbi:SDR family NAD(P)-dependent oxidoreductase [Nonomuraea sp. MTCD27]|uniref:SDR family NAD(P)-dependent oxidoreductase n=1 Tax=Nonomuraea sp. MTCD27 TaxID=1676747 RepID=UPI0035C22391
MDVVVHNAAHLLVGVTEAVSPEEVSRDFDVNAVGALRVNRAVLPVMRRQESRPLLWIGSGTTRRAVADGSDHGGEIVNGAAQELRLRLARRMGVTALLDRI